MSGTITLDGKPVEGAVITLISQKGEPAAQGATDAVGKYTLETMKGNPHIPAGVFTVTISKTAKDSEKELLPRKYSLQQTSGLTVEVAASGVNELCFELTTN